MKFKGYKYTFKINAYHHTGLQTDFHQHTFEISVYVQRNGDFDTFTDAEKMIFTSLSCYEGKKLNELAPFNEIEPTIENIGKVLFDNISAQLSEQQYKLFRLDISETPYRIYSILNEYVSKHRRKAFEQNARYIKENIVIPPLTANSANLPLNPRQKTDETEIPYNSAKLSSYKSENINALSVLSNKKFLACALILLLTAIAATVAVALSECYPLGLDIHGHLFKSDLMYDEICKGNLYPLYSQYWYNGIQVFRYWPPAPYYFMAFLQFIGGGNVMNAYLGFVFSSVFIGGFGWLLFARRYNRPYLGLFMAVVWFFLPDNMRVFFGEGNLPRMFITMLLPLILYCLWEYVDARRKKMIIPLLLLMITAVFGHLMISAMIGVGCFVFMLIYSIANKCLREPLIAILTMLFSFAVAGIWVFPSLVGGLTAMSAGGTSELMASLATELSVSLNPILRLEGAVGELYFGLSVFLISVIGLFLSNRKSLPGFASMLIVIAGTTTALTPLIQLIPFSQLFWVRRFTPIAYAMFVIAVIQWKKLKKPLLVSFCAVILLDCIPSANLPAYDAGMNIPATVKDMDQSMVEYMFKQAKEITQQRVSVMDLSMFGPMPSYAFGSEEPKTPYVFGWAWQGAATAENIVAINEALENQNFSFVFDRHLELGADTVIFMKSFIDAEYYDKMLACAQASGYHYAGETDEALMFSLNTSGSFGVITDYKGISIGTTASIVPQLFPYFVQGDNAYLDDYTYDDLKIYSKIYLSGFFYNNKKKAETLVQNLAKNGVEIYIDMSNIPSDPLTTRMTFLNVSAQPIMFNEHYPDLVTDDKIITPGNFIEENSNWNTVYLNNLTDVEGYSWFEEAKLDFIGTAGNKNITFLGFNLLYHSLMANDNAVYSYLNDIMELDDFSLPERTTVPLQITYTSDAITIVSPEDNVNTTIAYQDIFSSEQKISSVRNMLVVDKGTTVIKLRYPYFIQGLTVTVAGICAEAVIFLFIFKKKKLTVKKHSSTQGA